MSTPLGAILARIDGTELAAVASTVLGAGSPCRISPTDITEITKPHYDPRTIGVAKVSGTATMPNAAVAPWSAVCKVIDLAVPPKGNSYARPETEELVYERGLFADQRFRAARCYHVSRPTERIRILWLEDLTAHASAPFGVEQVMGAARHLGEWNGTHYASRALGFEPVANSYLLRWRTTGFPERLAELLALEEHPYTRALYGGQPLSTVVELYERADALMSATSDLQPGLAFGDCNVGNLFPTPDETIAVDWASLALDPLGVDAGCLVGSGMTFGRRGVDLALAEHDIFAAYVAGLNAAGYRGDERDIRRGYLCHYLIYAFYVALLPAFLIEPGRYFKKDYLEKRYQTPWDEIPSTVAPLATLFPGYVEELRNLAV